jgi:hypothetical protein
LIASTGIHLTGLTHSAHSLAWQACASKRHTV